PPRRCAPGPRDDCRRWTIANVDGSSSLWRRSPGRVPGCCSVSCRSTPRPRQAGGRSLPPSGCSRTSSSPSAAARCARSACWGSAAPFVALNHTSVANVLFMQALAPILAAVLGTFLGDPVGRRTWLAMGVAVAGVALMVGGPGRPSALGLGLSLVMSASFAGMIVLTRHHREVSMAPATFISQLLVLAVAAPFAHPGAAGGKDVALLATLGICQIGLGFALLTVGARLIPAGEVALITLLEIVLGPLWVWAFLSQRPSTATLIGG